MSEETTTVTTTAPVTTTTTAPVVPVKPGYKTTEFWLTTAAALVGALIASGIIPATGPWAQVVGLVCAVLGTLGYTVARGQAKK